MAERIVKFLMEQPRLMENVLMPALMAITGAIIWTGMVPERKDFAAPAFLSWGLLWLFFALLMKIKAGVNFPKLTFMLWCIGVALMLVAAPPSASTIEQLAVELVPGILIATITAAVWLVITRGVPALIKKGYARTNQSCAGSDLAGGDRGPSPETKIKRTEGTFTRKITRSLFVYEILRIDPDAEPSGYEVVTQVGVIYPYPVDDVEGPRREEATWIGTKEEFEALVAEEGLDWPDWIRALYEFHCSNCLTHVRFARDASFAPLAHYLRCPECGREFPDIGWHTVRDVRLPRVVQRWLKQRRMQPAPTSPDPVKRGNLKLAVASA